MFAKTISAEERNLNIMDYNIVSLEISG
jgi:hypothetical protein